MNNLFMFTLTFLLCTALQAAPSKKILPPPTNAYSPWAPLSEISTGAASIWFVQSRNSPLRNVHLLEEKFALGEITKAEFLRKLRVYSLRSYGSLLLAGGALILVADGISYILSEGQLSILGRALHAGEPQRR